MQRAGMGKDVAGATAGAATAGMMAAAAPRTLEPIAALSVYRPSTASGALEALAPSSSPVSISRGVSRRQDESRPGPEPAWAAHSRERSARGSGLTPVPAPLQYRPGFGSPVQGFVTISEQMSTQQGKRSVSSMASHTVSNSRASVSKIDSRKVSSTTFSKALHSNVKSGGDETRETSYADGSGSDSSDDRDASPSAFERRREQKKLQEALGRTTHEEGGKKFKGSIDNRGITPYVTFTSVETPPSESKNPLTAASQPTTCGFCSSTNLMWVLRCSFCGSARMSDAPRLKYLIDMILSVDPTITPSQVRLSSPPHLG